MRHVLRLGIAFASFSFACSSAPPTEPPVVDELPQRPEPPPPAPTLEETQGDELQGAPIDPPSDPAPDVKSFRATVATTPTIGFGGDPFCNYRITMKNVVVDVRTTNGQVSSASVRATAVEEAVAPCTQKALAPNEHLYVSTSTSRLASGVIRVGLGAKSTNMPIASGKLDVDLSKPTPTATLDLHRSDAAHPLDWTVTTMVTFVAN